MNKVYAPIKQMATWPTSFKELQAHMDLASKEAGVLGWGAQIDAPEYQTTYRPHIYNPFLVVRDPSGDLRFVNFNSDDGRRLLNNCAFVTELLLATTDPALSTQFSELEDIYWSENEDVGEDDLAYGFDPGNVVDLVFITDGRAIAAWNTEDSILRAVELNMMHEEEGDEDEDRSAEELAKILIPEVGSAHDAIEMTPVLETYVAALNKFALKNDRGICLSTPKLAPRSAA